MRDVTTAGAPAETTSEVQRLKRKCDSLETALRRARSAAGHAGSLADSEAHVTGVHQQMKEQHLIAKYSDTDSVASRQLQHALSKCNTLLEQKESLHEEFRRFKEAALRDAAEQRSCFESRIAHLTDRAFKIADPEVQM